MKLFDINEWLARRGLFADGEGEGAGAQGGGSGGAGAGAGGEGDKAAGGADKGAGEKGAGAGGQGADKGDKAASDWRAGITNPEARKLAEDSADINHLAERALNMRQKLSGAIMKPGKDAKPEEVAAYRKAMGVPDAPDGYVFEDPEGYTATDADKAIRGQFAKVFHDHNVPAETAKGLTEAYRQIVTAQAAEIKAADEKYAADSEAALKKQWGADYDANVAVAERAAKHILGEDYAAARRLTDSTGRFVLDNPVMLRMLAKIGREMGEDGLRGGASESELATIDGQITDLRKQQSEAQAKGDSKLANQLYQKEQGLIAKRNGSQPVVGARGRAA